MSAIGHGGGEAPARAIRDGDIEKFARDLEARGRGRPTVPRRLCTVAGFYRYAVEEELLSHSPAAHVRRPRLDYESHATGLDRNELGALLVAAGLGPPAEHALISLLALNGLRVSEATGALDAGVPLRDVQEAASHADPRTTMRQSGPGHRWTGMPPTSSPPTSPEQRARSQRARTVPPGRH